MPRNFFALKKGKDKADFLSVVLCLIANGVLPADGDRVFPDREDGKRWKKSWVSPHTQDEMALAMGLGSRATLTKRLSYLRGTASDKAGKLKPHGAIDELLCPWPSGAPARGNALIPMLDSRRNFAQPNVYSIALPRRKVEWVVYRKSTNKAVPRARFSGSDLPKVHQAALDHASKLNARLGRIDYEARRRELDPNNFYYPTAHDIIADADLARLFNHAWLFKKTGELDFSGTFDLPEWVWHASLGISDTARLVLSYYIAAGLITDKGMDGKPKGWIQPKQRTVANRCGISTKTVHKADRELEAIGIIRVVGTVTSRASLTAYMKWAREQSQKEPADRDAKPREMAERWRKENIILFLPIRTMTDVEILAERRRLLLARRAMHEQRKMHRRWLRKMQLEEALEKDLAAKRFALALQVCRATRMHRTTVEAHKGLTARINAIWASVQQKLLHAGIDRRLISALIPTILAPPHPMSQAEAAQIKELIERSFKTRAWRN